MTTRIGIAGIGGRMGREIAAAAQADSVITLVGGFDRPERTEEVRAALGPSVRVVARIDELLPEIEVLIDFTTPEATVAHARACAQSGRPLVSGVTGLTAEQLATLREASATIPVFYARNMSLGISALLAALPALVRSLQGYDIEIVEQHHRHKTDAPSGTALALAEAIAGALGADLSARASYGRHGHAPRRPGEIGIHAVRAGGNAGEHVVIIADEGEEIRVSHRAYSRRTFALGALRAAAWLRQQPPGWYGMADLIAHS